MDEPGVLPSRAALFNELCMACYLNGSWSEIGEGSNPPMQFHLPSELDAQRGLRPSGALVAKRSRSPQRFGFFLPSEGQSQANPEKPYIPPHQRRGAP